jgi:hypothetical protein
MFRFSLSLAAACVVVAGLQPALAQRPQHSIYVAALDSTGKPVEFLNPEDIVVQEDRATREVLDVTPSADPMEIVILVDNSQAADPFIRDYRQALPAFIKDIAADETGARHQFSIVTIADRPTINADYTLSPEVAIKGTERIFAMPGSGSYLLDAIVEVTKGINKRNAVRPVIVAIVTEGPELSNRNYLAALDALRGSRAAFHVVTIGRPTNNNQDRNIVLADGTKGTGGRYETVMISTALTARMKQLAQDLTHQFKVTYSRPQTLLPPEKITVTAAKSGLTIRSIPAKVTQER